jgi:hypothetical protein
MRTLLRLVATLMILLGGLIFSYRYLVNSGMNMADQTIIYLPPALGAAMVIAGIAVLIMSQQK